MQSPRDQNTRDRLGNVSSKSEKTRLRLVSFGITFVRIHSLWRPVASKVLVDRGSEGEDTVRESGKTVAKTTNSSTYPSYGT